MARGKARVIDTDEGATTTQLEYRSWMAEIDRSKKRSQIFREDGKRVVDRYRLEGETGKANYKDRYNILYSSTETIKPSLYTKRPKVEATQRNRDAEDQTVVMATLVVEQATDYALDEIDFDTPIKAAIEDFVLPGMGQVWVRYEPTINGEGADEYVEAEGLGVDYVYWEDFLTGLGRTWPEVPWVGRRVYFNKKKATKRFGAEKANQLSYSYRPTDDDSGSSRNMDRDTVGGDQSEIYEVWDKDTRTVFWLSKDYPDLLDKKADFLRLNDFFPCPQPMRAVHNNKTFVPKAFYSQYRAQAEELDDLTKKIRILTKALRVLGVYDATQEKLAQLMTGDDNKLVPVENWASFSGQGGMDGSIQWLPIKEVAEVLNQLLSNREVVKSEIYEITGFSDIVRGVSKASETLGAQQIKQEWAGGRLRAIQTDAQNFVRDVIRIMSEIICEHFKPETLALYAGFEPPPITPEEQAAIEAVAQAALAGMPPPQVPPTQQQLAIQQFEKVAKLLKNDRRRCALIGIETDSTIQPDEAQERKDRMEFLSSIGAFLQQAGPMALQFPDMRGLLGAIMMFTVKTFRQSRSIEKAFEDFTKKLANAPPTPPPGQEGDDGGKAAEAQIQTANIKAQTDMQTAQITDAGKQRDAQMKAQYEEARLRFDHEYRMAELALKERELALKETELRIKEAELGIKQMEQAGALDTEQREAEMAAREADREDALAAGSEGRAERQEERADEQQAHQQEQDGATGEREDRKVEVAEVTAKAKAKAPTKPKPKA